MFLSVTVLVGDGMASMATAPKSTMAVAMTVAAVALPVNVNRGATGAMMFVSTSTWPLTRPVRLFGRAVAVTSIC